MTTLTVRIEGPKWATDDSRELIARALSSHIGNDRLTCTVVEAEHPWEDDYVQFARLIAEIEASGPSDGMWASLQDSMDLSEDELSELFDRAQEAFVPQMANFDLVGGVSFKKGCYPGQEIVARMQYRGGLKRRMALAHIAGRERPQPGENVYSGAFGDQSAGTIVNAAPAPEGGFDALVVAQIESLERRQVRDAPDAGDDVLGARLTELPEPVDDLRGRVALQVDPLQRAALDLVVGPAKPVAVLAQDRVLVANAVGAAEEVGGVRVLGDEPQGLLLAAAADHDRHPGPRDGLR